MQMASYVRVSTLAEALAAAQAAAGPVLYFAGGTDILVRQREDDCYAGSHVIDIYGVEELRGVTDAGERLRIGALTTHAAIAADPLVKRHAEVLALASETVGSWQIRSHATIGGNIGNASPAADTFAALAVLDAQVEVRRGGGALTLPLYDVIVRPYATCLQNGDLITAVTVKKLPEGCRSRFYKLGRRRALAISRMTVAAVLRCDGSGTVDYFDMTLGATFPRPQRFAGIPPLLLGKRPGEADVLAAAKALADKIPEVAGIRHSTAYKQPVAEKLAARVLRDLLELPAPEDADAV